MASVGKRSNEAPETDLRDPASPSLTTVARPRAAPCGGPEESRRRAGGMSDALELASSMSLEKRHLKSCFRGSRPTLATFDLDWLRTICLAARDLDDIQLVFQMLHSGLGASSGALVNVGPTRQLPIFEMLVDVPPSLSKAIKSRRVVDDPMMVACEQRILGFAASDLDRVVEMNRKRRETMAIYEAHGLQDGFTVPLCVPGEPRGFCSFGYANPDDLTLDVMAIINLSGAILFESARRVLGMWVEHRLSAELTPRQVDCVAGVAQGLKDVQIGWKLGISAQTVHDHLEAARKRCGARNRTDLVVKAIRAGDLHWNKIVGNPVL